MVHARGGQTGSAEVASLTVQQAIREAFPGAIYLHMARGWRVHEWRNTPYDRTIRATPTRSPMLPQPLIRTFVNFSLDRDGVVEGRCRRATAACSRNATCRSTSALKGS